MEEDEDGEKVKVGIFILILDSTMIRFIYVFVRMESMRPLSNEETNRVIRFVGDISDLTFPSPLTGSAAAQISKTLTSTKEFRLSSNRDLLRPSRTEEESRQSRPRTGWKMNRPRTGWKMKKQVGNIANKVEIFFVHRKKNLDKVDLELDGR